MKLVAFKKEIPYDILRIIFSFIDQEGMLNFLNSYLKSHKPLTLKNSRWRFKFNKRILYEYSYKRTM